MIRFLVIAGLVAAGVPRPSAGDVETITIDIGSTALVCAGLCPDFRLTASSSGVLEIINRRPRRSAKRWHLSKSEFGAFQRELLPVRPAASLSGSPCNDPDVDRKYTFEISWTDRKHETRLSSCDHNVWVATVKAERALRVDHGTGRRLRRGQYVPTYGT
jgi:hypothetical protein